MHGLLCMKGFLPEREELDAWSLGHGSLKHIPRNRSTPREISKMWERWEAPFSSLRHLFRSFCSQAEPEICVTFLTPFTWEILGLGWKGSGLPCLGSLASILCFLWQDYAPPLHPNHCLACLGKLSLRSWISPSAHSVLKRAQVPPKLNTWAVNDLSVFFARHRLDSFGLASGRKVPHPRPPKPLEGDEPTTWIHGMFLLCLKELFTDIETCKLVCFVRSLTHGLSLSPPTLLGNSPPLPFLSFAGKKLEGNIGSVGWALWVFWG